MNIVCSVAVSYLMISVISTVKTWARNALKNR